MTFAFDLLDQKLYDLTFLTKSIKYKSLPNGHNSKLPQIIFHIGFPIH